MDKTTINKLEYEELVKMKAKYLSLMKKSIISLTGPCIYCKVCNTVSKDKANVKAHVFKEEL